MDASFDWAALAELRDLWPHKLVVKGITSVEDALLLEKAGVDAVIFSNHGGRQVEDLPAPIHILRQAQGRLAIPMLLDSGVRSGTDIVKVVAAGASMTMSGRAVLYGLAAGGAAGAREVIDILKEELDSTLALIGCARADALTPDFLYDDAS
jgi:(S)-mandelate dehydrogenase